MATVLFIDDDMSLLRVNRVYFEKHGFRVFTAQSFAEAKEIYREVWKLPDLGNVQTVRTHLARMRSKLEEALPHCQYIGRRWGKGFYFCPDGQAKTAKEEEAN